MNGNLFIVYTIESKEIGLCAIALKIPASNNLIGYGRDSRCKSLNVFPTWKMAQKVAEQWNRDFKNNGSQRS